MFKKPETRSILRIPPLSILGAIIIFLPIIFFITYQNIQRQQSYTRNLLLEKGAALIRSFEAGTRAGMRGRLWGHPKLQQLLEETAQQPDIEYLMVTDDHGIVIAHNKTDQIGTRYGKDLDYKTLTSDSNLSWRILDRDNNERIFEVYRRFIPTGVPGNPRGEGMMRRFRGSASPRFDFEDRDLKQVIFVGLDMKSLDEAGKSSLINSFITGLLLFLAGSAGIVLLFLFQNYRSTRTSLSRIKAFSDNLVNNMPIGLVALDATKSVTSANATALEVLHQTETALVGKPISQVLPAILLKLVDEVNQTKKIVGYETECQVTPERTIPVEISVSIIEDDNQKVIGYAVLLKDLSEIYQLRREVARSQKLASIGRLAAGVAHEIRNPLSSIKGFATYFRDRYKDVDKDRQTANVMINEVDRLDRVVGQLLELARPVNIIPQLTEVGGFIRESIQLIEQNMRNKNIILKTDSSEQPCECFFDRDKISQVLLNLYLNAIDAMESNGVLKVGFWYNPGDDSIHITVMDTGKGIEEKDLGKIFDPYYTTKPTGTGLGLAIVHNILEAHHGKINVNSKPGAGTTVTITIPNMNPEKSNG